MPANPAELSAILSRLRTAPVSPLPADEAWAGMIQRISTPGVTAEVSEETFDYFLDVLPPKWMGRGTYSFAEGEEPLRVFWKANGKCYCHQLTWDETVSFCQAAGIPTPH